MRCAVCGSKRVVIESKNEGYNTKKGILGTALFGLSGAILGANGNKTTYYHCADCGQVLNRCMNEWEENEINSAILNKDEKPYYLEQLINLKKKYKNIEFSNEDEENAVRYINSKKYMCDEDVISDLKKHLNKSISISLDEMNNYMKKIGYNENVIKDIPFKLAYSFKSNIRIANKNNICYFSIDNNTPLEILQEENQKTYYTAFKSEIENRDSDIKNINDLGNEILNYILSKKTVPVSKSEIIEKYPQVSWVKIVTAIQHNGYIKSTIKDKEYYYEIDSEAYEIKKLKEEIVRQNNEKIKNRKKDKLANANKSIDTTKLLDIINNRIEEIQTKEEVADLQELKKLYLECRFTKSFSTDELINKIDYVYAIYIILKGNNFTDVEYTKFFRLHSVIDNDELNDEEKIACRELIIDCFHNDINIIKDITFENISKISNNAERDFEYINGMIMHELELINKK